MVLKIGTQSPHLQDTDKRLMKMLSLDSLHWICPYILLFIQLYIFLGLNLKVGQGSINDLSCQWEKLTGNIHAMFLGGINDSMQSEDGVVTLEGVWERLGISGGMLHLIKLERDTMGVAIMMEGWL